MRRQVAGGFELDDDRARINVEAVHAFLSEEAYWALGRPLETQRHLVEISTRVVGVYQGERQIGFSRVVTDGNSIAYLADVYVLPEFRGNGLGTELVRESVENSPWADCRWLLHTADAHELYRKFGFREPSERAMERPRRGIVEGAP